ncbi:MAG: chloride channel protein [Acidobacteriaceae bacterium]
MLQHPLLRRYFPLVHEDLVEVYSRSLQKWLIIAPLIGVTTGLLITGITIIILQKLWPVILAYYLHHHWAIVPGMVLAFAITGLIMQFLTSDPDEHSTEEVIKSYHEHDGDIDMRPMLAKLVAAITSVGFGGSAALEGPSIYGGAAIGSWLWAKLRRLRLDVRDRRIMLICGAAAGMSAVFRAPLTGIVFALEMPYRDDLAHEALVPSLIASVVSFVTLSAFLGSQPLFDFAGTAVPYDRRDLYWSALLGLMIGLIAMAFAVTFRRTRTFFVRWAVPHWVKLSVGGLLTGLCGLLFVWLYHGSLIPLGPDYEAVGNILNQHHGTMELVNFGVLKMAATIFTLGSGGVSAMFVPLFLSGGSLGMAFAQSVIHSSSFGLYAAVGMAAFISAGYKTPLAAVVFVAEATGGHAYIIPALIGAAVAYLVSGDATASGNQRLHEEVRIKDLEIPVSEVMQQRMVAAQASLTLREFASTLAENSRRDAFPVFDGLELLGGITLWSMVRVPPDRWKSTTVRELVNRRVQRVPLDCDISEAARLLLSEHRQMMLLVIAGDGRMKGIVTKADILKVLKLRREDSVELSSASFN